MGASGRESALAVRPPDLAAVLSRAAPPSASLSRDHSWSPPLAGIFWELTGSISEDKGGGEHRPKGLERVGGMARLHCARHAIALRAVGRRKPPVLRLADENRDGAVVSPAKVVVATHYICRLLNDQTREEMPNGGWIPARRSPIALRQWVEEPFGSRSYCTDRKW